MAIETLLDEVRPFVGSDQAIEVIAAQVTLGLAERVSIQLLGAGNNVLPALDFASRVLTAFEPVIEDPENASKAQLTLVLTRELLLFIDDQIGGSPVISTGLNLLDGFAPFFEDPDIDEFQTGEAGLALAGVILDILDDEFGPSPVINTSRVVLRGLAPLLPLFENPEDFDQPQAVLLVLDTTVTLLTDLLGATPELTIMASVVDLVRPFIEAPDGSFDFADAITLARGMVAIAQDAAGDSSALTLAEQILNAAGDVSRFEGRPPSVVMVVTLIGLIKQQTPGPNPALDAAEKLILLLTDPIAVTRDGVLEVVNLVPDIFGLPAFLRSIVDLVLPPPPSLLDFPFCPKLDYAFATLPTQLTLNQSEQYQFDPTPRVKLVFPVPVQFTVSPCVPDNTLDPENPVVCSGTSNVVIYNAGSSVSFPYPDDLHTMRVTPTFMLPNQFSNSTLTSFNGSFQFEAGRYVLVIDPVTIIPEIELIPRFCIPIPFIGDLCIPALVFPALGTPEVRFGQEQALFSTGSSFSKVNDSMFEQKPPALGPGWLPSLHRGVLQSGH